MQVTGRTHADVHGQNKNEQSQKNGRGQRNGSWSLSTLHARRGDKRVSAMMACAFPRKSFLSSRKKSCAHRF